MREPPKDPTECGDRSPQGTAMAGVCALLFVCVCVCASAVRVYCISNVVGSPPAAGCHSGCSISRHRCIMLANLHIYPFSWFEYTPGTQTHPIHTPPSRIHTATRTHTHTHRKNAKNSCSPAPPTRFRARGLSELWARRSRFAHRAVCAVENPFRVCVCVRWFVSRNRRRQEQQGSSQKKRPAKLRRLGRPRAT